MAVDLPLERDLSLIFEREDVYDAFAGHCCRTHMDAEAVCYCEYCGRLRLVLVVAILEWKAMCDQGPLLASQPGPATISRPRIICLCGSTRFIEQFAIQTWELEQKGHIVLGCTLLPMWYCQVPSHFGEKTGTKEQCDDLHKRKIDLADEILVLNYGGYIGESTRSEIEYAGQHGKPVRYVEPGPATSQEPT